MRRALVNSLTRQVERGGDIYVLSADAGFRVFDEFRKRFPDRFINVGVSESAMVGLAAGLAHQGKQVFCYGIVPFVTLRCLEQVRVDLCCPGLPVKIVGVGGGLTYGAAGMTHHALEDIAVMSALPNMTVVCPGDPVETEEATEASLSLSGPCYIRIGKTGEKVIHTGGLDSFVIGKGVRLRGGRDIALIATGNMLATAAEACDILSRRGERPALISMHTVKPIDRDLIINLAGECSTLVTVEEHSIVGGLGSMVAGVVADGNLGGRVLRFALPDEFPKEAGSQEYFRRKYGLTAEQIAEKITR